MTKAFDDLEPSDIGAQVEFLAGGELVSGGLAGFGVGGVGDGEGVHSIRVYPSGAHVVASDVDVRFLL